MSGNKESGARNPVATTRAKAPAAEPAAHSSVALTLQQRIGNADLCALLQQVRAYATPALEAEADRMAAQTLSAATQAIFSRKRGPPPTSVEIASRLAKSGVPLSDELRNFFEPRLGVSLDAVRVHTDESAREAAQSLNARAFAYGPHLLFNRDAFAPHTERGKALLAHELAHVAQQAHRQTLFIGLQPGGSTQDLQAKDAPKGIQEEKGPGYLILKFPNGHRWLKLEWDPQRSATPPHYEIREKWDDYSRSYSTGLYVHADFPVRAVLDRSSEGIPEDSLIQYRLYSYYLDFPGQLSVDTSIPEPNKISLPKSARLSYRERSLYLGKPSIEFPMPQLLDPPTAASLDPLSEFPPPTNKAEERGIALEAAEKKEKEENLIRGHSSFGSKAEMEEYIRAHPGESFVGIETSYGRFVARKVSEEELERIADALRREGEEGLDEVGWDAEKRRSAWGVTGIYQKGKAVDLDDFRDLWFSYDSLALAEAIDGEEEYEVFRMGQASYGRRILTHEEAVKRWLQFDSLTQAQIMRLESEPGRKFHALHVRGVGRVHVLDARYFRGRHEFMNRIAKLDMEWVYLHNEIVADSAISDFLMIETDREQDNPNFVAALKNRESLAEAAARVVFYRVQGRAQRLAYDTIKKGRDELAPYAEEIVRMQTFIIGLPEMNQKQREEAFSFIGMPENYRGKGHTVFANAELAINIALGHEHRIVEQESMSVPDDLPSQTRVYYDVTYTFSLEAMMGWAQETLKGIDSALTQLENNEVEALRLDGELGNLVRERVYKEFGFLKLNPKGWPHEEETVGWWPDPLDEGTVKFGSLAERMYANCVQNRDSDELVLQVLKITALVLATVILIFVAQGVGAAAAGLLFAEGSAAFIATELIVSGLVFTALNEVRSLAMEGRPESESVGDFVGNSAINIATFGAFRFLNVLLAAGAKSFVSARVGGKAAFEASRGAQRAAEALRITGVGATFMTIGLVDRLRKGQSFKSWSDFALFAYENLLTLALLEGGAVLARPLLTQSSIWARKHRLGELEQPITALRGDIARLQRDLASLSLRPQAASRDAPGLAQRATELLNRQRALAEKLKEKFSTRSDGKQLETQAGAEIEMIKTAIAGIEQAKFLTEQRVTPIEGSESVFSYEGGAPAAERFGEFYGKDKVRVEADGTVRVEVPGLETRELVFVPAESLVVTGGVVSPPPVVSQQLALHARQKALLSRAKRLGVTHKTLDAIKRLRPSETTRPEKLKETEEAIAAAEKEAGAKMDEVTQNILKNVKTRLGKEAIDQIRAGELSKVTDAELADILWQARGLQNMGVPQLRGLVFAARPGQPPIDFPKLLRTMRRGRFKVADRNFALETFTQMMELGVGGARQMLADMSTSTGHFRGGLFQMEVIRFIGGVERVASIEKSVTVGSRQREYDLILRDGTRIECKDWGTWEYADSLADGFERDMISLTNNFSNPAGLRNMRYIFRRGITGEPPRPIPEIRAFLRERLVKALADKKVDQATRDAVLKEYDDFLDLISAPDLQRTGGLPLPTPTPSPPSPALPDEDEDEEEEEGFDVR